LISISESLVITFFSNHLFTGLAPYICATKNMDGYQIILNTSPY
jgi:hypothetical protein